MNILFLVPPKGLNPHNKNLDRVYGCNYGYDYKPCIHLLSCATVVRDEGYDIRFLDCPAEKIKIREFISIISKNNYDAAIFFSVYLSKQQDLKAAKLIRQNCPETKIIFIGTYPTWRPEEFIISRDFMTVRGEPEETLKELIDFIKEDKSLGAVSGISFLNNGDITHNPMRDLLDINSLPIPDRSLLKGRYFLTRLDYDPITVMCVSRGCSYRCKFCAPHALDQAIELEYKRFNQKDKPPLRLRSIEKVVQEFKEVENLCYKGVEICDNQFIWGKHRILEICKNIKNLNLKWLCYARGDSIEDEEVAKALYDAGCELIYIGTETFNQRILDDLGKDLKIDDNYKAVKLLKKHKIRPEVSILMGASVFETKEIILDSIRKARNLNTDFIHYSIALPFPNTEIYDIYKKQGFIKKSEFYPVDNTRDSMIELPRIGSKQLTKILRKCYLQQYFSVRSIISNIKKISSFNIFMKKLKILYEFLKFAIKRK